MSTWPFIEAEKAEHQGSVKRACELLEVSRAAFYEWSRHVPSPRQLADDQLAERIQAIYDDNRSVYGWPRMHQALRRQGVHVSGKRVARIMRQRGLMGGVRGSGPRPRSQIPGSELPTWWSGSSRLRASSTGCTWAT